MRGASRASLNEAKELLTVAVAAAPATLSSQIGDELFAVTGILDGDPGLRRALSDPARDGDAKVALARALFSERISVQALRLLEGLVRSRWSAATDLPDATEQLAVLAVAAAADAGASLDELQDELFRFGRIVQGSPGLRSALSNQFIPVERRRDVVAALLRERVHETSLRLITQAASTPRGRSLDATLEFFAGLVAELRERVVAEVHVAVPITDAQRARLAGALTAAYGHPVHLNVVLDPQLVGGISVRVKDELINGSVASKLAELRRGLAA